MHKQSSRLEKLEQAAEAKRTQVHPVTPDCGTVDALGWPTTPEGWAILVNHAVTLTAGRPEVLERLRVAYGDGL